MPRARQKPSALAVYQDINGEETPAQRAGVVYAFAKGGRDNDVRKHREHPLDRMAKRGAITGAERDRAMAALDLYDRAQAGPGALLESVDRTPDPDLGAVLSCQASFSYAEAVRDIPPRCRRVFDHVVLEGRYLITLRGCRTSHDERKRQTRLLRNAIKALNV